MGRTRKKDEEKDRRKNKEQRIRGEKERIKKEYHIVNKPFVDFSVMGLDDQLATFMFET